MIGMKNTTITIRAIKLCHCRIVRWAAAKTMSATTIGAALARRREPAVDEDLKQPGRWEP